MPRKVRDANLETRTARSRLKLRKKPYFRLIEPGLHLGYRKLPSGPGTWIARRYNGEGGYVTENLRTADDAIVLADDYADADGEHVLTFAQAQQRARSRRAAPARGSYTVADATADYLRLLDGDGRSKHAIQDARYRVDALILPALGKMKVAALMPDRLRRWRDEIAKVPARIRTREGEEQKYREKGNEEAQRARRASANRTWTVLRAALNHAFNDSKVESDVAWRKVKPFRKVDLARVRYLTTDEAKRLINACDPEFRPLVQAGLATGARYGELVRLQARDFNTDAGTVAVRQSKSGKPRHVVLTGEGVALFRQLTTGQAGDELILRRANGEAWGAAHQSRPMREAVTHAKIKPTISFHGLRHSWASLSVMAGMPLMVVARNLGHVDTRMVEKHYGHLAPSFVADAVRKSAPRFGFKPDRKIAQLDRA
jgi:integrase